ncbi:M90 family metallopeptidase [Chitinophaga pollutisoli]|uniref:M90 family metallopeptidase n=1 Tax=Chitinophaga pollutisoli TaxID=3133966 RepID=A0ABZ2YP37_9BACT
MAFNLEFAQVLPVLIPVVVIAFLFWWFYRPRKSAPGAVPAGTAGMLEAHVRYYQQLTPPEKERFSSEVEAFLGHVTIEGVGTEVEDLDRILIAASAVIPIFSFPGWKYRNLTNIILYPDTFDEHYQFEGDRRNILGMVGSGHMNGQMLLSRSALRAGFSEHAGQSNTAIHEFVHLVDKTDGYVDGLPQSLLHNITSLPWLQVMHEEIRKIESGHSEINPYAAMNQSEFLAVTAEYFFEKPDSMQTHHPELYRLLSEIFRQDPAARAS